MRIAPIVGTMLLGACAADAPVCSRDGGRVCFELPEQSMVTYEMGGNSEIPQLGCGAVAPVASTMPVVLGGHVKSYDSSLPIAGARVDLFEAGDYATALATATTDAQGAYSINLPQGTPDLLWAKLSADGMEPLLLDQTRPDLSASTATADYEMATPDLLDQVAQVADVDRDPGLAQLAVHVLDCNRRSIMNVVVVLSATAGMRDFVDGVPIFYSTAGYPLPAPRKEINVTQNDGTAVIVNAPVGGGDLYVQAWGFPDAAAVARGEEGLVMIAEHAVERRAGSSTWVNLWANQD